MTVIIYINNFLTWFWVWLIVCIVCIPFMHGYLCSDTWPSWVWIRANTSVWRWLMKKGKNHLSFSPQNRCPNALPSTHLLITTVRNCLLTLGSFPCCWGCCYVIQCIWAPKACTTLLADIIIIVPSSLIILMIHFWSVLASRIKHGSLPVQQSRHVWFTCQ